MAVIYLRHKQHGTKVACMEEEAKADEKNGWERYSVDDLVYRGETVISQSIPNSTADAELLELRIKYQEQFGKKAHHKKTVEILKQELAA